MKEIAADYVVRLFPYVAAARLRRARTLPEDPFATRPPSSPGAPLNRIGRQQQVSTPDYRPGVGVSTDTLYTSAWLDLADGPLVLETPQFDGRYYSFQVGSADTSSQAAFGARTHGDHLPPVLLHWPDGGGALPADLPGDLIVAASTTRYCNLPGRMLVDPDDPADMATAHRLQDGIRLRTWEQFRSDSDDLAPVSPQLPTPVGGEGVDAFLREAAVVVEEDGLSEADRRWLAAVPETVRGILLGTVALDRPAHEMLKAAYDDGRAAIDARAMALGTQGGGWTVNLLGPRFGDDVLLRAGVARDQIYVTVPEEGIYPVGRTDEDGRPLHGDHDYRIRIAAGVEPPADAFWSITLYDTDGFLVENSARIHAINGRTALRRDDGAIEIAIGREPAGPDMSWIPAPPREFYLMMRLFLPTEAVRTGAWMPPPIRRAG